MKTKSLRNNACNFAFKKGGDSKGNYIADSVAYIILLRRCRSEKMCKDSLERIKYKWLEKGLLLAF